VGFFESQDLNPLRKAILDLRQRIIPDPHLSRLPSIKKTLTAVHAKDDAPEIRDLFCRLLYDLNFKAQIGVAGKHEPIFG
jgi:hypothetical protein